MTRVHKTALPRTSRLWGLHAPGDFIDGYAVESTASVAQALETGFAMPGWARGLLALRNLLVAPFGLKTGAAGGDSLFPLHHRDETEIVMGTDDRHLDFRIALLRQDGRIHMATWVRPHNAAGRAYLALVMPFHILLSRNSLARVARSHRS